MARAGAPEQGCPGVEHCGWLQEGENPCAGCGLRNAGSSFRQSCLVEYSLFLAAYVEAFRPEPRRLTWLDLDLYQAVLAAKAGYESEQARKFWKK